MVVNNRSLKYSNQTMTGEILNLSIEIKNITLIHLSLINTFLCCIWKAKINLTPQIALEYNFLFIILKLKYQHIFII